MFLVTFCHTIVFVSATFVRNKYYSVTKLHYFVRAAMRFVTAVSVIHSMLIRVRENDSD